MTHAEALHIGLRVVAAIVVIAVVDLAVVGAWFAWHTWRRR